MGEMSQTQTVRLRQEVLRVGSDGAADVRSTFLSLRSVMDGPMGRQEYDSERPDEAADPAVRMAGGMVGASLEMTIGANGEIRSMRGVDALMERMLAPFEEESPEQAAQVRATMESVFGEEQLTSQMQQAMATLPSGPIRPGHTWSGAVDVRLPFGTMRTEYTYRLDDVVTRAGRTVGLVSVSGTTGALEPDPDNPMAGMMELSGGEMTGTLEFDADRGILLDMSMTTVMESDVMGTPMNVETTLAMELVEG